MELERDAYEAIMLDESLTPDEQELAVEAAGVRQASNMTVLTLRQHTEITVLTHALSDLRGPAALTGLGVLAGTIASVWSLYLPD